MDLLDQTLQDIARTKLVEFRGSVRDHTLHTLRPTNGRSQLLQQLLLDNILVRFAFGAYILIHWTLWGQEGSG